MISFIDAAPPDASLPDAFVCVETDVIKECGPGMAGCVNITNDNMHCGGCDMACSSAGQACVAGAADGDAGSSQVAHCECPPEFVPANPTPLDLMGAIPDVTNQFTDPDYVGTLAFLGSGGTFNALLVTFNIGDPTPGDATPIDSDIDLSTVSGVSPRLAAGYNIDIFSMTFQAGFLATAGTLHLDYACATGIAGTATGVTFSEVADVTNPVPVAGGCSFTVPTVSFAIGDDCTDGDAGPGNDAG